jgi:hypothetical protein
MFLCIRACIQQTFLHTYHGKSQTSWLHTLISLPSRSETWRKSLNLMCLSFLICEIRIRVVVSIINENKFCCELPTFKQFTCTNLFSLIKHNDTDIVINPMFCLWVIDFHNLLRACLKWNELIHIQCLAKYSVQK